MLRFWETRFPQIKPLKRGGGRRYYRPEDVELLRAIKRLLYGEGYTIKGVQKLLKEQGARAVATSKLSGAADFVAPGAEAEPLVQAETAMPAARHEAKTAAPAGDAPGQASPRSGLSAADLPGASRRRLPTSPKASGCFRWRGRVEGEQK